MKRTEHTPSGMELLARSGRTIGEILAEKDASYDRLLAENAGMKRDRARLMEAMKYIELSTRPDGQWADQAVCAFAKAALKSCGETHE